MSRTSLSQRHAQLVFMLELMESFLDLLEVFTIMGEQGVAEEVLLSPIEAFRMVRIQSLQ